MKTSSGGATAVQIVWSFRRGSRKIEHIGSAHDDAELEALKAAGRQRLAAGQLELDLSMGRPGRPNPPRQDDPIAPARRSAVQAKASRQHDLAGRPYRSFRGLLGHLASLTRNQVRFADASTTVPMLAEPTAGQRQAFGLLDVPIPLTL